jgi:hypothetical protein
MPRTRSRSSGKPIPMTSSPLETEGSKRWNQSTSIAPLLIHKPGPLFDETPARRAAIADVYLRGMGELGAVLSGVRTRPQ